MPLSAYVAFYDRKSTVEEAIVRKSINQGEGTTLSRLGLIILTTALTQLNGLSYAADKITLTCSDGEEDYSLSLDLDKKLASFDMHSDLAVDIPIVRVTDTSIWFQNESLSDIYSEGTLNRVTGSLHLFHRSFGQATNFHFQCKPAKPSSREGTAPTGDTLSKLRVITLPITLTLVGLTGYAAEKINLTCSGTVWMKGLAKERPTPNPFFVIDLDEGIVTSSLGEFAITELTPSRISFKAKHGETAWYGGVDRFSGDAIVTVQRSNEVVTDYKLACKGANPLF